MTENKPFTVPQFIASKGNTPIVMITAADFTTAYGNVSAASIGAISYYIVRLFV